MAYAAISLVVRYIAAPDMRSIDIVRRAIDEALCLLPDDMDSLEAELILLAISGQESNWEHRWQIIDKRKPSKKGPARSFWQGERGAAWCSAYGRIEPPERSRRDYMRIPYAHR